MGLVVEFCHWQNVCDKQLIRFILGDDVSLWSVASRPAARQNIMAWNMWGGQLLT